MSSGKGLNDYMNSISSFGSNVQGVQDWAEANTNEFFQDWRDKTNKAIAEATKKGQAAIHVGEEIGGAYVGAKAVKAAYQKYFPGKKGSDKPGDDEGEDQEGDGDEADQAADNDAVAPDEAADAGSTPLDATQEGVGESTSTFTGDEPAGLPEPGGEMELQDASNFGQQAEQGASLSDTINQPSSVGTQAQQSILDADPEAGPGGLGDSALDAAGEGAETAGSAAAETAGTAGADAAAAAAGGAADAAGGAAAAAGGAAADAAGAGLAAGLGVAAEAIPVVGALAAIGVGLYELFHHHAHPKPQAPSAPASITATKSSFVLPSFDSVVDTPASSAAF